MTLDPEKIAFKELYSAAAIQQRVNELGQTITLDFAEKPVVLICILKGAVMFAADLARVIKVPLVIDFMGIASYEGMASTGQVRITQDLSVDIKDRHVLVVEDIIDTGQTLSYLIQNLQTRSPKSIKVCALLDKPAARQANVKVDYCGFTIANQFVIGYGLDLDQRWRELPFIAQVQG